MENGRNSGLSDVTDDNCICPFSSSFWDDKKLIVYAAETDTFNIIMNKFIPDSNILFFRAVGRDAICTERQADSHVIQQVVNKLKKIYPVVSVPTPTGHKISRFSIDPLVMAARSVWPPGFTKNNHDAFKAPVDRIYFAGEHTSMLNYGYLQGAYFFGNETVNLLDQCIQQSVCQKYVPIYAARGCRYRAARNYDRSAKEDDSSCNFTCKSVSGIHEMPFVICTSIAALSIILQQLWSQV